MIHLNTEQVKEAQGLAELIVLQVRSKVYHTDFNAGEADNFELLQTIHAKTLLLISQGLLNSVLP